MRTVLLTLKWLLRSADVVGCRCVHVVDSQVCIGVLCKGRTSARLLKSCAQKIAATVVASSTYFYYVFVESAHNPADKASRL